MRNLLTSLALCVALPLSLDSVIAPYIESPIIEPAPSPNFSLIKPNHAREYIAQIYPYAVKVQEAQGVPIPITLAIACLESGYGRSNYAKTRHNHFGIRAYYKGKAEYRRFSSLDTCFEFYTQLFDLERYAPLRKIAVGNLPAFVQGLQDCGFNHRDGYRKKLLTMIDFLKLEELTASALA